MAAQSREQQPEEELTEEETAHVEIPAGDTGVLPKIFNAQEHQVGEEAGAFGAESADEVADVTARYGAPFTDTELVAMNGLVNEVRQAQLQYQKNAGEITIKSAAEAKESAPSRRASLWERARAWKEQNKDRITKIKQSAREGSIKDKYGESVVDEKRALCISDPDRCAERYVSRLEKTGRTVDKGEIQQALDAMRDILKAKKEKKPAPKFPGRITVLMEEMTQELAYAEYRQKKEKGDATLGAEGIAVDMMIELDLEDRVEIAVESIEQAKEVVAAELNEYVEKGYINEKEAELIAETVYKFADAYERTFEGKKFPGGKILTKEEVIQQAFEAMRDNARKIAFQTKLDKRAFSGSDHGTRHICEGCTHLSEGLMNSLSLMDGKDGKVKVDFEPQDEVLIRQIIIDHDIGYTTDAAQAEGGFKASKDHPCAGCDFVESNKDYYVDKYGDEGYEIIRDVVLNHSYVQSEYKGARPEAPPNEITYNRDLIRSVVSTVDAMGVTSETKAMDLFRNPKAVDILQKVKLYSETHGGKVDSGALQEFKDDLDRIVTGMLDAEEISQERAAGFRQAIKNHFNPQTVEITLGQFTGVVREMKMTAGPGGKPVPEISMDLSRLAALVGDNFGDKTAVKGFVKAMEDFGLTSGELQNLAETWRQLSVETDPEKREGLQEKLKYTSDRATFIIGERETTSLDDARDEELRAITEMFENFERATVRTEIKQLFEELFEKAEGTRGDEDVFAFRRKLVSMCDIGDEESAALVQVMEKLKENINNDEELKKILKDIILFKSKEEKDMLQRYEDAAKNKPKQAS